MTQAQIGRALRRLVRLQRRSLIARRAKAQPSVLSDEQRLLLVITSRQTAQA